MVTGGFRVLGRLLCVRCKNPLAGLVWDPMMPLEGDPLPVRCGGCIVRVRYDPEAPNDVPR